MAIKYYDLVGLIDKKKGVYNAHANDGFEVEGLYSFSIDGPEAGKLAKAIAARLRGEEVAVTEIDGETWVRVRVSETISNIMEDITKKSIDKLISMVL